MKLSEEEQDTIVVGETISENDKIKERWSLIGKVFTDRNKSKMTISGMVGKIWRISKLEVFTEVGKNCFIITFAIETDNQRVANRKP